MNQERALQTLQGLVENYSPSGSEQAAVQFLVNRFQQLGYDQAFIDEAGNAVGIIGSGEKTLLMLGHIDTVPGQIPIRIEDGVLFGRGSVDAKGPLASFTEAAAGFQSDEWQVMVIAAVGEETDSPGAMFVRDHYSADAVIIGEPSQWQRFTLGYKGSCWVNLYFATTLAHTAGQQSSACELAFQGWASIQHFAAGYNIDIPKVFEQIQPTLRGFSTDSDGFNDIAILHVGCRLPMSMTPDKWLHNLQCVLQNASFQLLGEPLPAFQSDKNTFLARLFLRSIRANGGKPGFVYKTGTADFNIVGPAWNVPILAYGPGDSALDHTPNEHLPLADYFKAIQVLENVLQNL
ncbi:MAG: [LysW]-lysine hydrolase [Anaerolineaceae bacterium]|nr:[LysW]-lysine hydrolase [Anaerolineaceae bacterium]